MNNLKEYLAVSTEVQTALEEGKAVVALESTIISHGMPYPKNVETALKVEEIVRQNGAIPATIAIINGKITVGLTKEEIETLGKEGLSVPKASRRDLPMLCARKSNGATTVATTMIGAALAGIPVFATGGIGGVHRGAEKTMDISADLEELGMTPVMVVCAGCKSILDIGLTLEYLETKGVPVLGYQTEELPAFYTTHSGYKVDYKLENAKEAALAFHAKEELKLQGGMIIANPIPTEFAMDLDYINKNINEAVKECEELGIKGKEITPFLLDKIQKLTEGKSLASNIELVYNNAKVATEIAIEYAKIK